MYLVDKAPPLPKEWKETLVKVAPWLVLVFSILSLPALLAIFGLGAFMMPFSYLGGIRYGFNFFIDYLTSAVSIILGFIAIPGLFQRSRKAWYLLYYATLVGAVGNLLTLSLAGLVIGSLLSLYILFQVKEYYK